MNDSQIFLWNKLKTFELDDADASFTFSDRLARENGWTHEFSLRAIEEYKRFIFLVCITGNPLTPSDAVDQVWHLHLLYTQSYWDELCGGILHRKIHHGPTRGGSQERTKYDDAYSATKDRYTEIFQQEPPADLWPSNKDRFSSINFQRVDLDKYWIIKKPFV